MLLSVAQQAAKETTDALRRMQDGDIASPTAAHPELVVAKADPLVWGIWRDPTA
jgi:hypothetical protein